MGKIDIFNTFGCQADMSDTVGAADGRDLVTILQFCGRALVLVDLQSAAQGVDANVGVAVDVPVQIRYFSSVHINRCLVKRENAPSLVDSII